MGARKYSSLEKAAIAMLALGEAGAAQVLAGMNADEVRRIAGAMSRIGRVDQATADAALAELRDRLTKPVTGVTGGADSARRLLGRLGHAVGAGFDPALDLASPALRELLAEVEPRALAPFLQHEHPQSATVILAHLDPKTAGETLRLLPDGLRVELVQRMARLGPIEPETLHDLADGLKAALAGSRGRNRPDLGGSSKVAELLGALDREQGERLLASLTDADPELAAKVRSEMFRFADVVKLDDAGVRTLLKHVPESVLILALKAAPDAVRDTIFRNMSERASARIKDDLAVLPKTRKSDAEDAQRRVVETVLKLLESGELELPDASNPYV